MSKKIFFFDIDGTILQEQSMSKRVFDALNNIRKNGDYCFIASGRPPTFIPDIIKEVGFDGYILANGAYVEFNGNIINEEILDYNMLDELLKFLRETKNDYILQTKDACYLNKKYLNLYNYFKRIGLKVDEFIYEFDEKEIMKKTIKVEVWPNDYEAGEIIKEHLIEFSWNQYEFSNMELYSNKVSKASGIEKVIQILNIKKEDTYAFGDGRNDLEMFEIVEHSYAMGNASEEVKAKAKYVCPSIKDEGVAIVLEKILEDQN